MWCEDHVLGIMWWCEDWC